MKSTIFFFVFMLLTDPVNASTTYLLLDSVSNSCTNKADVLEVSDVSVTCSSSACAFGDSGYLTGTLTLIEDMYDVFYLSAWTYGMKIVDNYAIDPCEMTPLDGQTCGAAGTYSFYQSIKLPDEKYSSYLYNFSVKVSVKATNSYGDLLGCFSAKLKSSSSNSGYQSVNYDSRKLNIRMTSLIISAFCVIGISILAWKKFHSICTGRQNDIAGIGNNVQLVSIPEGSATFNSDERFVMI